MSPSLFRTCKKVHHLVDFDKLKSALFANVLKRGTTGIREGVISRNLMHEIP